MTSLTSLPSACLPVPLSAVFPTPPHPHGVDLKVTNSYSIESQCKKGGDLAKRCCWGSKGFIYMPGVGTWTHFLCI